MPKKTTILIAILAVVTVILLFLAITNEGQKSPPGTSQNVTPTKTVAPKTARVFFSPTNLDLSAGAATTNSTADIMVDTGTGDIAGVQVELQYDPKAITNVKILPDASASGFFGPSAVILFNDVNAQTGRVSFAIAINAGGKTRKGTGRIATLNFTKAFGTLSSTTVTFLDKTLVTTLGQNESVLKDAAPLNIVLKQTQQVPVRTVTGNAPVTNTTPYVPPTQ